MVFFRHRQQHSIKTNGPVGKVESTSFSFGSDFTSLGDAIAFEFSRDSRHIRGIVIEYDKPKKRVDFA